MMPETVKNILVVKLCCLGDIIFLTPSLRALRAAYPEARITLLISRWVQDLMPCIPFIDDYILFDAPYAATRREKVRGTLSMVRTLRRRRFDIAFVAHRNRIFKVLVKLGGAPVRAGFAGDGSSLLTHSVPFDERAHEVDRYLQVVASLSDTAQAAATPGARTELRPLEEDCVRVENLLRENGVMPNEMLLGLFPGGGENPGTSMTIKRWDVSSYAALIEQLFSRRKCKIALLGSKSEIELNESIRARATRPQHVLNLAGATNLRQFVALAARCALFIGGDSGPTHMAAAAGTPTISIFGPSDPRLVAPRGAHCRTVWQQVACSPCYTPLTVMDKRNFDGKNFLCHTGTLACMRQISVREVLDTALDLMSQVS
jgi:lipopolysaccharide heptosyltransferase II